MLNEARIRPHPIAEAAGKLPGISQAEAPRARDSVGTRTIAGRAIHPVLKCRRRLYILARLSKDRHNTSVTLLTRSFGHPLLKITALLNNTLPLMLALSLALTLLLPSQQTSSYPYPRPPTPSPQPAPPPVKHDTSPPISRKEASVSPLISHHRPPR